MDVKLHFPTITISLELKVENFRIKTKIQAMNFIQDKQNMHVLQSAFVADPFKVNLWKEVEILKDISYL